MAEKEVLGTTNNGIEYTTNEGATFAELIDRVGLIFPWAVNQQVEFGRGYGGRELALAVTKLQEAIMWGEAGLAIVESRAEDGEVRQDG